MFKFVATAALVLTAGTLSAEVLDGVAAIVNSNIITYSEVRDYVQPVVAQLRRDYSGSNLVEKVRAAQADALNNLIERSLILDEFKDKGYSFPESVIDEQLNNVIADEYGGDRALFIKTLQAQNVTLAQYRDKLRDRIIVQAMRNRKSMNEVVASPYKIEQYYKNHIDDYKVDEQIKLRMIFIKKGKLPEVVPPPPELCTNIVEGVTNISGNVTNVVDGVTNIVVNVTNIVLSVTNITEIAAPPPPAPVDPRKMFADELVAQLNNGASFESLAKVYSEGREAKAGGDWGWISQDVLRKELSNVAFSLKAGQHSGTIVTPDGYYILEVDDVKPAHTQPIGEVRDQIEKTLLQQQRTKMQENWIKQLRAKAYIRVF
jgi:peptidyl-prolyl cis-trans isomerase SurA